MVVLMGAVSGEGRDYLTDRNGRHGASCCAADMVKSLAGGVGCLLIVVIVCGRADQRIAVNRRGYKNALAVFARKLEDGLVDQTAGCFVEQAVFAATRGNVDLLAADHVVKNICIHTGSVYHAAGQDVTAVGGELIAVVLAADVCHFCVKTEFDAVCGSIFCECNVQTERADNAAGRTVDGSDDFLGEVRLHLMNFVCI